MRCTSNHLSSLDCTMVALNYTLSLSYLFRNPRRDYFQHLFPAVAMRLNQAFALALDPPCRLVLSAMQASSLHVSLAFQPFIQTGKDTIISMFTPIRSLRFETPWSMYPGTPRMLSAWNERGYRLTPRYFAHHKASNKLRWTDERAKNTWSGGHSPTYPTKRIYACLEKL